MGTLIAPFPRSKVTSVFGWRYLTRADGTKFRNYHRGLDFGMAKGTPIRLAQNGRLFAKGFDPVIGYWAEFILEDGRRIRYHMLMEPSKVAHGVLLSAGAIIGHVGMSGSSATGPHLHVEILDAVTRVPIDPLIEFTFSAFPASTTSTPLENETMPTVSEIWNQKIRIGGEDVSVIQVVANIASDTKAIRTALESLPLDVWNVKITRGGKQVPVIQDLVDVGTAATRIEKALAAVGTVEAIEADPVDLDALATLIVSKLPTQATPEQIAEATVGAISVQFTKV